MAYVVHFGFRQPIEANRLLIAPRLVWRGCGPVGLWVQWISESICKPEKLKAVLMKVYFIVFDEKISSWFGP